MSYLTEPNPQLAEMVRHTPPGMAHWSGTGPAGATCGQCEWFTEIKWGGGKSTRCGKYTKMMNGQQGPKKIPAETFACKYFDPKAPALTSAE